MNFKITYLHNRFVSKSSYISKRNLDILVKLFFGADLNTLNQTISPPAALEVGRRWYCLISSRSLDQPWPEEEIKTFKRTYYTLNWRSECVVKHCQLPLLSQQPNDETQTILTPPIYFVPYYYVSFSEYGPGGAGGGRVSLESAHLASG